MKRPERLKLVEDMRGCILGTHKSQLNSRYIKLLQQSADCIEQLENELDKIHENFLTSDSHPGFE